MKETIITIYLIIALLLFLIIMVKEYKEIENEYKTIKIPLIVLIMSYGVVFFLCLIWLISLPLYIINKITQKYE